MEPKRVVVTGMGVVTSLGLTLDDFWTNLKAGKSGISAITHFDASGYATRFAGEIRDLEVERFLDRKEARRMDRFTQLAMIAAQGAVNPASAASRPYSKTRPPCWNGARAASAPSPSRR